jgi:acetyltransferase-like isoleucine patch superfamily enzyme
MIRGMPDLGGKAFLGLYRLVVRTRAKAFSLLAGRAFASFGSRSVIQPPLRVDGEHRISIGAGVFMGPGCWLHALDDENRSDELAIVVGDGTSIVGDCVLSAVRSVHLGRNVLIARNVYVSDHMHAFDDTERAVLEQGVARVAPVSIGDGAWLGQNVVVGPGVSIGRGAVVGSNSVVLDDVPDFAVAVGAPARVVRRLEEHAGLSS